MNESSEQLARARAAFAELMDLSEALDDSDFQELTQVADALEAAITGLSVDRSRPLGAYPMQVCGHLGDDAFYFRYRHDHATLEVWAGQHDFTAPGLPAGPPARAAAVDGVTGEPLSGWLDCGELTLAFTDLHDRLAPTGEA